MSWHSEGPGWVMRVLISLVAFILVFLVGVKTEWIAVSRATSITSEDRALAEEGQTSDTRAYEAVVLGETRPDATSGELIDAAVSRGEISSEQGLLYGVYLACGDSRLPARFRGQDLTLPAKNILWEAHVEWDTLSPDIQGALRNFFVEGAAATPALACADELAQLKGDPTVWWSAALGQDGQPLENPVRVANN